MGILFEFLQWLPTYFFPKICYGCGKEGSFVCNSCRPTVDRVIDKPICPVCRKPAASGATHPACRKRLTLDGLTSYYHYNGWAKAIVRTAKFGKNRYFRALLELSDEFATILAPCLPLLDKTRKDWVTVPIPLHWWRERKRGYNQASLIARRISSVLHLPIIENLIRRVRYTSAQTLTASYLSIPQATLKKFDRMYPSQLERDQANNRFVRRQKEAMRKTNVAHAFEVRAHRPVPSNILLIDDVWTTGATMSECTSTLKRAGVKTVWGVTLLRA